MDIESIDSYSTASSESSLPKGCLKRSRCSDVDSKSCLPAVSVNPTIVKIPSRTLIYAIVFVDGAKRNAQLFANEPPSQQLPVLEPFHEFHLNLPSPTQVRQFQARHAAITPGFCKLCEYRLLKPIKLLRFSDFRDCGLAINFSDMLPIFAANDVDGCQCGPNSFVFPYFDEAIELVDDDKRRGLGQQLLPDMFVRLRLLNSLKMP